MRILARLLHKRRLFVYSPLSPLGLYAYVGSLLTPVPAPIVRCLIEGLKHNVVCQDDAIRRHVPFRTIPYREALSSRESEFLTGMEERCEKYGEKAFVSLKQIFWLRDLEQRVCQ